jgi:alpha-beta hydrolase superfamily lysophospholipase
MGPNTKLASHLSSEFTVFTYDRRGRGESGDRAPYGVEREIEDLQAVIDAAGGSACVYGISSGGALALEATNRLSSIERLALHELPFVVDDTRPPVPADWAGQLAEMAATDRRADASAGRAPAGRALDGRDRANARVGGRQEPGVDALLDARLGRRSAGRRVPVAGWADARGQGRAPGTVADRLLQGLSRLTCK